MSASDEASGSLPADIVSERGVRYRRVQLWDAPIRAMHWVAAACILVLAATGFYIGNPYFMTRGEAVEHFAMGNMRLAHFIAAGVLVGTGVVRVYWLFAGNRFESWRALFPVDGKSLRNLVRQMGYYLLLPRVKRPHYLGHNPLQQVFYTGVYALVVVQVLTGFAMFGLADPEGFFWRTLGIQSAYIGGIRVVRFVHHVLTWVILVFIPIHVYLGVRADVMDREGTMSSIFSGSRWVRGDVKFEDE
jgi:Ni/Fe-hydrogenase 1 B-type cytochrome subunit